MSDMELKMVIKAINEAAAPLQAAVDDIQKVTAAVKNHTADVISSVEKENRANADYWLAYQKYEQDALKKSASLQSESAALKASLREKENRANADYWLAYQKYEQDALQNSASFITQIKDHWLAATAIMASAAGAIQIGKSLLDAGIAAESMGKKLSAALGSVQAATEAQKFLRDESERLGLVFMDQVGSYVKLSAAARGTSLEGEETRKIFTAITSASTALGLSADETSGALRAIQQMMAKGKITAEELTGQLSERLPDSLQLMAQGTNKSTAEFLKMSEAGEALATDVLPKFADALTNKYGAAATKSADLTQANINRMKTAFQDLKATLIEDFMPAISSSFEGITNLIRLFPNLSKAIGLARTGLIDFSDIATANGKELNALVNNFDPLTVKIAALKTKIDEIKKAPMGWASTGQLDKLIENLKKLEEQQTKTHTSAKTEMSEYDKMMVGRMKRGMDDLQLYVDNSAEREKADKKAAETAKKAMSEAEKASKEYNAALSSTVDSINKLTLSADDYARTKVWEWYEKEAESLGRNNEYLLEARDLKLADINAHGEQAKAIEKAVDAFNKMTMSAQDYAILNLKNTFEEEARKIGDNAAAMDKLNAAYKANVALQEYLKNPLPPDPWIAAAKDREDANKRSLDIITKEEEKAAKATQKLWDHAWKGIEDAFSDTIYDMMDEGVDSFSDFFDKIQDLFKKMLAELVAAWITTGIKDLFTGTNSGGFSLSGILGLAGQTSSLLGGGDSGGTPSSGGGAVGTASSALSLASLAKSLWNLPETLAALPDKFASAVSTLSSFFGLASDTSVAAFSAIESTAMTSAEAETLIASYLAQQTAETGATIATSTGTSAASSVGGSAVAGAAGTLFAVMQFVASDTFKTLYTGGGKTTYQRVKESDAGGTQLDPEIRDWLMGSLLASDNINLGIADIVTDMDSFVETHKELLSMTTDKFDYLIGQQMDLAVASKDTSLNSLGGFGLNYGSDAAISFAATVADDVTLTLQEKMYQLGFFAAESGGWESAVTFSMLAEFSDAKIPWSDINQSMIDYGVTDAEIYKKIYAKYMGLEYDPAAEASKDIVIPVDPTAGGFDTSALGGRASGGQYDDMTPFWAGEAGAEIIDPRTRRVFSHEESMRISGGRIPGYAAGTGSIGYSASAEPKVIFNITNATGGNISAKATRISKTEQGLVVDMLLDAIERDVGGKIRSVLRVK